MVYFDSNIVVRNFTYRSLWIFYLFLAISIKIRSLGIKLGTSKFALLIGMHYFFFHYILPAASKQDYIHTESSSFDVLSHSTRDKQSSSPWPASHARMSAVSLNNA
jgi:hypothetical protein